MIHFLQCLSLTFLLGIATQASAAPLDIPGQDSSPFQAALQDRLDGMICRPCKRLRVWPAKTTAPRSIFWRGLQVRSIYTNMSQG